MPLDKPRIIIEKSSTVRRRYQRSNKRFTFTAEQIKRIEREEAREKRAKDLREKEKRRIANKKKKTEKEAKAREEARLQGLPDPFGFKIPASQPLLSKFLGLKKSAVSEEPETTETEQSVSKQSSRENSPPEHLPLKQQESIKRERPGFQNPFDQSPLYEQSPPEQQENIKTEQPVSRQSSPENPPSEHPFDQSPLRQQENTQTEPPVSRQSYRENTLSEPPFSEQPHLEHAPPEQPHTEFNVHFMTTDTNNNKDRDTEDDSAAGDTELDSDIFDDLDEEMEHEMAILQEAQPPAESEICDAGIDTSAQTLCPAQDDDEFSDCSVFDDDEILKEADAAAIRLVKSSIPMNPISMQPPADSLKRKIPLEESFRDDTADYLEEVFARGSGVSFGELVQY
ncbi:hypothetical protein N7495_008271 [Penicillium taxi]|uniref:uncharacterized protein n=1 Tax=Penicillium taxi TaxID=168475 RepID=UPI002545A960|nr:uncharacterized protein N7495_008271 [Penicillium taxi]KAJ5888230.1 hypothetical protein N7495_008271 [Penicillium taxi]